MNSPRPHSPWADLDALLVREHGSYLHNVIPGLPGLCEVCSTPVAGDYARCWPCSQMLPPGPVGGPAGFVDRVAFLTYAVEGGQAYSVLRGYKNPTIQERYWTAAATWVVWLLGRHGRCALPGSGIAESKFSWATVPSVRSGRRGEHPLHDIVRRSWGTHFPETPLALAAGAGGQGRSYRPIRFIADPVPAGGHVVLIDDSWTTGANVQSAATALKRAGAAQVSALVLGRLLKDTWEPTRHFIERGGLRSPFDPAACPWRGVPWHAD